MKNLKVIVALVALIAASNACAAVTVLQKRIAAAVDKVAKNPSVELSAEEKTLLSKHLNSNDANIKRLKSIEGFDMSQLGVTSSPTPNVYVAPDITTLPAPMNAPSNKPLTAAQRRAAARAEAAVAKTAPVTTAPVQKAAPGQPLTAAQKRAARKEANIAKREANIQAPTKGKNPFAEKVGEVNPYAQQPKALAIVPFDAYKYYDKETGLLTKYGIDTLIMNTKKVYPNLTRVQLISAVHERAADALRPERFSNDRSEYLAPNESNELMAMINREVLETDKQSKSAPRHLPATPKPNLKVINKNEAFDEFIRQAVQNPTNVYNEWTFKLNTSWFDQAAKLAKNVNPNLPEAELATQMLRIISTEILGDPVREDNIKIESIRTAIEAAINKIA